MLSACRVQRAPTKTVTATIVNEVTREVVWIRLRHRPSVDFSITVRLPLLKVHYPSSCFDTTPANKQTNTVHYKQPTPELWVRLKAACTKARKAYRIEAVHFWLRILRQKLRIQKKVVYLLTRINIINLATASRNFLPVVGSCIINAYS
jgi:hypothetical protein